MIYLCDYCGRYGPPGSCEGCGAPNRPAPEGVSVGVLASSGPISTETAARLKASWKEYDRDGWFIDADCKHVTLQLSPNEIPVFPTMVTR